MKSIIINFLAVAMVFSFCGNFASAAGKDGKWSRPYGMAGCGLGSQVVGKRGGQISAATTNGTSMNQLFAITMGTSNCVDDPSSEVASRMDKFIVTNRVALVTDIARGNGETLSGLLSIMGCQSSSNTGTVLQSRFNEIFPDAGLYTNEVTDNIISVIKNESAVKCSQVVS